MLERKRDTPRELRNVQVGDETVEHILIVVFAALFALALFFLINYWPLRKWLRIKIDPTWKHRAKPYVFANEDEEREERDPLLAPTIIRDSCDVIWHDCDQQPPEKIFEALPYGTVVHVNSKHIPRFIETVLPRLASPIVLVTGFEDASMRVPGFEKIIEHPRIIHWFIQNFELDPEHEDRITKLPLGFDFHKLEPNGVDIGIDMGLPSRMGNQQLTIKAIREEISPLSERPCRVYANFHLNMDTFLRSPNAKKRFHARREARGILQDKPYMFFEPRQIPRIEVWLKHREFAFEISPRGNAPDCHRTWEALLLKCIPIVKSSPLDSLYDGLPVVIVDDWGDIDEASLSAWKLKYQDAFDGPIPERLYARYWTGLFRSKAQNMDAPRAADI